MRYSTVTHAHPCSLANRSGTQSALPAAPEQSVASGIDGADRNNSSSSSSNRSSMHSDAAMQKQNSISAELRQVTADTDASVHAGADKMATAHGGKATSDHGHNGNSFALIPKSTQRSDTRRTPSSTSASAAKLNHVTASASSDAMHATETAAKKDRHSTFDGRCSHQSCMA